MLIPSASAMNIKFFAFVKKQILNRISKTERKTNQKSWNRKPEKNTNLTKKQNRTTFLIALWRISLWRESLMIWPLMIWSLIIWALLSWSLAVWRFDRCESDRWGSEMLKVFLNIGESTTAIESSRCVLSITGTYPLYAGYFFRYIIKHYT